MLEQGERKRRRHSHCQGIWVSGKRKEETIETNTKRFSLLHQSHSNDKNSNADSAGPCARVSVIFRVFRIILHWSN